MFKKNLPKMALKKIALFLTAISFAFIYFPRNNSSSEPPLSPPTIFQEGLRVSASGNYADSVRGHIKLITVAISIGEYLLIDKASLRKLERAIKFQFSDNRDFLKGVYLKRITCKNGVVKMPYRKNGAYYMVKMHIKTEPLSQNRTAPSDKLEIAISRIR